MSKRSSFSLLCRRLFFFLLALAAMCGVLPNSYETLAQGRRRGNAGAKRSPAPTSNARSRERTGETLRRRRGAAVAALTASVDEARLLDDADDRARSLTLFADVLWAVDQTKARAVFREAWAAATAADKAAQEEVGENAGVVNARVVTEARDEVLAAASLRDKELAEIFLRALLAAKDENNSQGEEGRQSSSRRELSAGGRRRLALAYDLLNKGEARRAAEIAAPLTSEGASADLIAFLLRLREEDAVAADKHFLSLVGRTRADINRADENDVLLLSSYIFSPQLLVTVDANGAVQFRVVAPGRRMDSEQNPAPPVANEARAAFFETAVGVLLRPPQVSDNPAQETNALARSFFAVERLLPFFEREAPQYAQMLRAQRESLAGRVDENRRQQLSGQAARERVTSANASDPLRSQANQLAAARTEDERDRLRVKLVGTAVRRKMWIDARRFAAEIADAELRRAAQVLIASHQIASISDAFSENATDDYERAAEFVKKVDVPPLVRAWGLAQAALMAKKRNRDDRARELLGEASTYATQAEVGDGQRAAAFAVITKTAPATGDERAWEWLTEAMRATNSAADFDFEEESFSVLPDGLAGRADETTESDFRIASDQFRLDAAFAAMSKLDAERAFMTARALESRMARLLAVAAIARSVLEQRDRAERRIESL